MLYEEIIDYPCDKNNRKYWATECDSSVLWLWGINMKKIPKQKNN